MQYNYLNFYRASGWWTLAASIPVFGFIILLCLGFDGLFGQDSYEYLSYAKKLKLYLMGGEYPGDIVWPKAYLGVLSLGLFIVNSAFAGQLLSFCCFLGTALALYKIVLALYQDQRSAAIFVTITFLLSAYMFRTSVVVMSDAFSVFCLTLTFHYALNYASTLRVKDIILFSLTASLGVFSRYAVLVPLAPIIFWTTLNWLKGKQWKHALALLFFLVGYLFNEHLEGSGSLFLNHHLIKQWSVTNFFESEFINTTDLQQPSATFLLPNLLYNFIGLFHPGFFLLSPLLIFFALPIKRPRKEFVVLMLSCVFYLIFLSGLIFQSSRYLLLIYPLFLVMLFPAFIKLMGRINRWERRWVQWSVLLLIGAQLALLERGIWPSYSMNSLEREVAESLMQYEGSTLYSFELDISLQQRGVEMNYKSLWKQRYTSFEKGGLVLFNPERVNQTFKGKNPMLNWKQLSINNTLVPLLSFKDGWNLYKIEND